MVFDYVAGKQDWLAHELPVEGKISETHTIGNLAERNPPTCSLTDSADAVRRRLRKEELKACVVVNDARVVLGLLPADSPETGDQTVEAVMEPGPSTFRPHTPADEAAEYFKRNKLDIITVTTSDGRLVGVLKAEDLPQS